MSLWKIAWRSVQKRGVASLLTTVSMALGVMLVVCVLSIYGVVDEQFRNNASLGYNMLVGAKGGKLQLTLNSVYYLSEPVENIDYRFYLEFFNKDIRDAGLRDSFAFEAHRAQWDAAAAEAFALSSLTPGLGGLGSVLAADALERSAETRLELGRDGEFGDFCKFVIPLCLGDYFGRFRVVGTTPDMFEELIFDVENNRGFEFAQGRNFQHHSEEHGYFEAVVGAQVAREMKVALGDVINPAHGDPEGHGHDKGFTVVGILAPSGTPNDRAVFVNIEGFYLMADHAKPIKAPDPAESDEGEVVEGGPDEESPPPEPEAPAAGQAEDDHDDEDDHEVELLPLEQREVTAVLVRTVNPFVAAGFQNLINEGKEAQAVQPVKEIYDLLDLIVKPVQMLLLGLTVMICMVSGVSILVSIYNSMSDRRHEIAVMRALGADRNVVMTIILLEAIFLSLGGGVLGWTMGHSLNVAMSSAIEARTGVSIGFFTLAPPVDVLELMGVDPSRYGLQVPVICLAPWVIGGALVVVAGAMGVLKAGTLSQRIWWLGCGIFLIIVATVGYFLGADDAVSSELLLIPGLMLLAVVVGFFPALSAYKTDVAQSLGK